MSRRVHFLNNCCHTCKKLDPTYQCEICNMVYYCSENDRRNNWQAHSQLCRALFKLCQAKGVSRIYENAALGSADGFRDMRHAVASECAAFLGRPLEAWELEILYWPKVCNVCFKQTDDLISCNGCRFVFTCSMMHFKENHGTWCSTLKFYNEITRFVEKNGVPFVPNEEIDSGVESMKEVLDVKSLKSTVENSFLAELLTYPLTVYRAIRSLQLPDDNLTIHVIGAELQAEVLPLSKWEKYLLHLLPNVQKINLIFIGPDLQPADEIDFSLCQNCRNAGKILNYKLVCCTVYHDYLKQPEAVQPNLITALNAGLYRLTGFKGTDTWTPTLVKLFQQPAPILITEYTSCEINKDKTLIEEKFPDVELVEKPAENPFASIKPSLNVISDEETPVIFKNYYSMVLQVRC